ncbi:MAG: efflux RND transporter periplasmic adaptor subunit [Planctomycetes bacterium]|nr:efflux RND transporter periplasmic adaptor subunit [Planctomycetota bacterium]
MRVRSTIAWLLAATTVFFTACSQPPAAEQPEVVHYITALTLKPQPFKVEIKLPCLTKPREVIELRATASGIIADLPYRENDNVPASASPQTAEKLEDLKPIVRIEDTELQTALKDRELRLESARRALKRVLDYADSTKEQIDAAQTGFDAASTAQKAAVQAIRNTYIVSPMAGVLTRRMRQKGEFVNHGELIAIVNVLTPMVVNIDVPEAHVARLKQGDEQSITFAALEGVTRKAKVSLVDRVAHPQTHTFRVELEMDNADGQIPAGVFGTMMLTIYDKPNALVIPVDAIKLEGNKKFVMLIGADRKAGKREVGIGQFTQNSVEITSGLAAGDRIAVLGARLLNEGDTVVIREEPGAGKP